MPRKKERKSGENKEKPTSTSTSTKAGIDEKEKGLYLNQIGFLNEELERFQIKCDYLEKQNNILISLDADKRDVTEYLKHSLSEKEGELEELLERLEGERQTAVQEKHSLQLENSQLRQELQARIDKLSEKNAALAEQLADLEEFQRQKDELTTSVENLEKQLERQKEEHEDELHSLEMKALLEKKRLRRKKEMESEVEAMSATVQHLVEQKLPEATRSVLQENTELKTRLGQLSEVARSLQRDNAALRERKRQLSLDTDILEEMLRRTSRISCVRRKDVQQLTGEFQRLQEDVGEKQQRLEQLQAERARVLADMEALRLDRAALSAEWSRNRSERNQLQAKLKEERRRRNRMKSIVQEAANALRQALKEAPTGQREEDPAPQWRQLLQNVQQVLDRQTRSWSPAETLSELQKSPRAESRSLQLQPSRHRARDPCLGSRAGPGPGASLCRTGAASRSSVAPLLRKPVIQKSSSSANRSHSSVGFPTSFAKSDGQNSLQINPKNTRKHVIIAEKYL
ncbi:cilia- and flagella-associated protein 157-like [Anableps anableps]